MYNIFMIKKSHELDIESIILMAWADSVPFETIYREYGLREKEVTQLMRTHQSKKTYVRWRKRVTKRNKASSKHELLSTISHNHQKLRI